MTKPYIAPELIAQHNQQHAARVHRDYDTLGEQLARRNVDLAKLQAEVAKFAVAVPSWGVGTGGTRFARFAGKGEPRSVFDKMEDCGVIQQLVRCTPTVSPHFPWDKVSDFAALREEARELGLGFDAVNSNTFQDQLNQSASYANGSLAAVFFGRA